MTKERTTGFIYLIGIMSTLALFSGCSHEKTAKPVKAASAQPSVYQMENVWQDQSGRSLKLSAFKGKIPLISMIFTRCPYACPRTIADLKNIEKQLPANKRNQVLFVLISFDDINDTPAQLRVFSKTIGAGKDWILLHGNEESIRELAMVLNVKYKKQPNGSFTHSSIITALDRNGAINTQLEGLGADPGQILSAINDL